MVDPQFPLDFASFPRRASIPFDDAGCEFGYLPDEKWEELTEHPSMNERLGITSDWMNEVLGRPRG